MCSLQKEKQYILIATEMNWDVHSILYEYDSFKYSVFNNGSMECIGYYGFNNCTIWNFKLKKCVLNQLNKYLQIAVTEIKTHEAVECDDGEGWEIEYYISNQEVFRYSGYIDDIKSLEKVTNILKSKASICWNLDPSIKEKLIKDYKQ